MRKQRFIRKQQMDAYDRLRKTFKDNKNRVQSAEGFNIKLNPIKMNYSIDEYRATPNLKARRTREERQSRQKKETTDGSTNRSYYFQSYK